MDTMAQMTGLKDAALELAVQRDHTIGPYQEYAGGAVSVAECLTCKRYVWTEIYPTGHDTRGSALVRDCGPVR